MASVSVFFGGQAQFDFSVDRPAIVIGRDATCDVRINNPSVSRKHAQLLQRSGSYMIKDLNSSNGTYVRGQRISESFLADGDEVTVGLYTLRFNQNGGTAGQAQGGPPPPPMAQPVPAPFQPPQLPTVPMQNPAQPVQAQAQPQPQQWAPVPQMPQIPQQAPMAAVPVPQPPPYAPAAPLPRPGYPPAPYPPYAPPQYDQRGYQPQYRAPLALQQQDLNALSSLGSYVMLGGFALCAYSCWTIIRVLMWKPSPAVFIASLILGLLGIAGGILACFATASFKKLPVVSSNQAGILGRGLSALSIALLLQAALFVLLALAEILQVLEK